MALNGAVSTEAPEKVQISPTNYNYYLATLVGEANYYDPTFYNDYIITYRDKKVGHFTQIGKEPVDFYFFISERNEMDACRKLLTESLDDQNPVSSFIIRAFENYIQTKPKYKKDGLYVEISKLISETSHGTVNWMIGENSIHLPKVNDALYHYLWSNGIGSIEDLKKNGTIRKLVINKFFTLSTTSFFRQWQGVSHFTEFLEPLTKRARKKNRPIKVKVYACSTGEEVISYAVELLEKGIQDFRILASDINEPSLNFARKMQYPYAAFSRLPLKKKDLLRKYFKLNQSTILWEPMDPKLFSDRIQYVYQDILEDLPKNLDRSFAPPYDIISILNVLLYLEDKAVKEKKDSWVKILNPQGILILHDKRYSVATGILGREWAFNNFYAFNEWVNIKTNSKVGIKKKVKSTLDMYKRNPSEITLELLNHAYLVAKNYRKSEILLSRYRKRFPNSYKAIVLAIDGLFRQNNIKEVRKLSETLMHTHLHYHKTLKIIHGLNQKTNDEPFLRALLDDYEYFLNTYKSSPSLVRKLFEFTEPSSKKFNNLKLLLKAHTQGYIIDYYIVEKNDRKIKETLQNILQTIDRVISDEPKFLIAGRFLNKAILSASDYFMKAEKYDDTLHYVDRGIALYEKFVDNKHYSMLWEGLGNLYLIKAKIFEKQNNIGKLKVVIKAVLSNLNKAYQQTPSVSIKDLRLFYKQIGQAFLIRGKVYATEHKSALAKTSLANALFFFEKSLEISPVYGEDIAKLRASLLETRKNFYPQMGSGIPGDWAMEYESPFANEEMGT